MDRSVDVAISRLRKKLLDNATEPYRIKTVRNKGYLFAPTPGITERSVCGPEGARFTACSPAASASHFSAAFALADRRPFVILSKSICFAVQKPIT
jgi:two-component system response regulator RstA